MGFCKAISVASCGRVTLGQSDSEKDDWGIASYLLFQRPTTRSFAFWMIRGHPTFAEKAWEWKGTGRPIQDDKVASGQNSICSCQNQSGPPAGHCLGAGPKHSQSQKPDFDKNHAGTAIYGALGGALGWLKWWSPNWLNLQELSQDENWGAQGHFEQEHPGCLAHFLILEWCGFA